MYESAFSSLLQQVADDIASIPVSAVQLVGAVIAMQHNLPPALSSFIMAKLALRADMSEVSPAAEAVMRMLAFSAYTDAEFAQLEIKSQHAFLKAVALDDKVFVAAAFMNKLQNRVAEVVRLIDAKAASCPDSQIASGVVMDRTKHSSFRA